MPARPKLESTTATEVSLRLLRPYTIGADSPYLSEDQQRLCQMTLRERSAWMAEWLRWAQPASSRGRTPKPCCAPTMIRKP